MRNRNFITIATSDGAQAEEVGREVARRLHYRYINEDVISLAARKARVSPADIDDVEHTQPLAKRIVAALKSIGSFETVEPEASELFGITPLLQWTSTGPAVSRQRTTLYRNLIREVLWELGLEGNVVIVAHAASIQLAEMEGVLRVFVTGSPEVRAERVGRANRMLPEDARKHIDQTDGQRRAYLKAFHNIQQEQPTHYDLVLNTDRLSFESAVDVILSATQPARDGELATA
jgi:Cytidylate kinase-like family